MLFREFLYAFGKCLWLFIFRVFYDMRVEGLEHFPNEASLIAANHISFYDPTLVGCVLPHPTYFLARKTLFVPPVFDWLLPMLKVIPIDQQKPDMNGLRQIIQLLRAKETVLVFPEGARAFDGQLQAAEPGIGLIISKTKVPIVPVRVFGVFEAWPRNGRVKFFTPLRVVIGKPLCFDQPVKRENYQQVGQEIMHAIAALR